MDKKIPFLSTTAFGKIFKKAVEEWEANNKNTIQSEYFTFFDEMHLFKPQPPPSEPGARGKKVADAAPGREGNELHTEVVVREGTQLLYREKASKVFIFLCAFCHCLRQDGSTQVWPSALGLCGW